MKEKKPQFEWKGIDLNDLRQVMDKPADDAIDAIFESKSIDRLVKILQQMAENDSVISKELPKPVRDFMKRELSIRFTPEDIRYFNQTREIWVEKGTKFILILLFRALPYTYMAEKPANVLRMTKLLKTQPKRRIFETAQFVFDVMEKKWWEPNQRGILTALKVRIMHAAMRQIILDNDYGEIWNDEWGKPISQEDLIATNQVFSLEFFKGMELLGDPLTPEQQEAWFHTWKTIGRIMGVQENLISKNVEEAWSLQYAVYDHLYNDKHDSGIILAESLAEALDDLYMPRKLVLMLMKKMLEDEKYPDCFELMLGPTFGQEFPDLFERPEDEEQKLASKARFREEYHVQLNNYHHKLNESKTDYVKRHPKKGKLENIVDWVVNFLNRFKDKKPLIEVHNNKLHSLLHNKTDDSQVEKLEEDVIGESLEAISGIVIGILAIHFREGKNSGFRIPKTLRANWARTGKRKKRWIWNIKSR